MTSKSGYKFWIFHFYNFPLLQFSAKYKFYKNNNVLTIFGTPKHDDVISRALYTIRHCRCGYLILFINSRQRQWQLDPPWLPFRVAMHNLLTPVKAFARQLGGIVHSWGVCCRPVDTASWGYFSHLLVILDQHWFALLPLILVHWEFGGVEANACNRKGADAPNRKKS